MLSNRLGRRLKPFIDRIQIHSVALAERHALQEAEYRTIVAASAEQGERAAERQALQASLTNAESAAKEQQGKREAAGRAA